MGSMDRFFKTALGNSDRSSSRDSIGQAIRDNGGTAGTRPVERSSRDARRDLRHDAKPIPPRKRSKAVESQQKDDGPELD